MLLLSLFLVVAPCLFQAHAEKVGIIHMHGFTEGWMEHRNFEKYIENRTGLPVHLLDAYNYLASNIPLEYQVKDILPRVQKIASQYDKVIAIGYSQGGVIWRAMIESWEGHNVDMFMAIASPQHGVYGGPPIAEALIPFLDWYSKTSIYKLIYSTFGQMNGMFNYYLDPTHYQMYLKWCPFFAGLNNEIGSPEHAAAQKARFLALRQVVLVGGPGDDVIDPWQSTQFGYYTKQGFSGEVVPMEQSRLYKEDLFGLKTLHSRGAIVRCTVNDVSHLQFRDSKEVMETCVIPSLQHYL